MWAFRGYSNALILILIRWRVIVELSSCRLHFLLFVRIWTSWVATQLVDWLLIVISIVATSTACSTVLQVLLWLQNAITSEHFCVVLWIGWGSGLIDSSMIVTVSLIICQLLIYILLEHGIRVLYLWVRSYHLRWFFNLIDTLLEYAASIWIVSSLLLFVSKTIRETSDGSVRSWLHMMSAWSSRHSFLFVFCLIISNYHKT